MLRPAPSANPDNGTTLEQPFPPQVSFLHRILRDDHDFSWQPENQREKQHLRWLEKRAARDFEMCCDAIALARARRIEETELEYFEAITKWVKAATEAYARSQAKVAAEWLQRARERMDKANAAIVRDEKRQLAARGLVRGRK